MKIYTGDCLNVLSIPEHFDLLYLDPPFGPVGEDIYYGVGDSLEEYVDYVYERIIRICSKAKNYNVVVQLDPKASHYLKVKLDGFFGRRNFQNEIIWGWSAPSNNTRHLPRKHGVLLWWGMGKYVFNPIHVPYKAESLRVGGKTSWAKETKDISTYLERGKLIEDWWTDIPPLVRNEAEKRGYATQKPIKLLERVVRMLSNPDGLVIDPMFGSGTTLLAAQNLGRQFIGSDKNPEAVAIAMGALEKDRPPFWIKT